MLWMLPVFLLGTYLVVVLLRFDTVITTINEDSDVVVAPVMAKLLGQIHGPSTTVLGNHPYYEEFLFLRVTAGLSFYRRLWEIAPMVWSLLGVSLFAWTTVRAFGRTEAALAAAVLVCLGSLGRLMFYSFDWHGLTVLHTIVVSAILVWLAPRADRAPWPLLLSGAVLLGLLNGITVASDRLFAFWALAPLMLVAVLMAARGGGRMRLTLPAFAITTSLVALVAGHVLGTALRHAGLIDSPFAITFVSAANIITNAELLLEGFMSLAGGYFFGQQLTMLGVSTLMIGLLVLLTLGFGLGEVRRRVGAAVMRPASGHGPTARHAYVGFWVSSLTIQSLVFVLSSAPVDTSSSRYVLAGFVSIAALIPVITVKGPMWRGLAVAGVSLWTIGSIYQLVTLPSSSGPTPPGPIQSRQLLRFASSEGVHVGYSTYWDAADLTWLTRFRIVVYPLLGGCGRAGVCQFSSVGTDAWYRPRPGIRSLLIADPAQPGLTAIPPALGRPLARTTIGTMTVVVYPFDIAGRL